MEDSTEQATDQPNFPLEGDLPPLWHQLPSLSLVDVYHGKCYNCSSHPIFRRIWWSCLRADYPCFKYDCRSLFKQMNTVTHPSCPPRETHTNDDKSSSRTPTDPSSISIPTHLFSIIQSTWKKAITKAEIKTDSTFDAVVHKNYETNLDGKITDDEYLQFCWKYMSTLPSQRYDLYMGKSGQIFLYTPTAFTTGIV